MASADVRLGPAHLGQGARKVTCTLRRCRHARVVASSPAREYWWLRGLRGRPRGRQHRVPHGVYPRDGGQHRSGFHIQVRGRGEGPICPGEALDGAVVGDTHPMASRVLLLAVPPLDQECPALGGAGPGLRGGGPFAADGEGTRVSEGRQQRGSRAISVTKSDNTGAISGLMDTQSADHPGLHRKSPPMRTSRESGAT